MAVLYNFLLQMIAPKFDYYCLSTVCTYSEINPSAYFQLKLGVDLKTSYFKFIIIFGQGPAITWSFFRYFACCDRLGLSES